MYDYDTTRVEAEEFLRGKLSYREDRGDTDDEGKDHRHKPASFEILRKAEEGQACRGLQNEDDFVVKTVMKVNSEIEGAYIFSSGKNMGAFKGVGNPLDIADFYGIEEYSGYIWTGHTRFPTNTPGWWGGAHPFTLLDWSIVHNGEISSYGINKRYLEMYGYKLTLLTDTEVVAYTLDLLIRSHGLDIKTACSVLAAPFGRT